MQVDQPPLAQYKNRKDYVPQYGDFIVWTGFITTWHGVVSSFNKDTNELNIIFSCVPFLLFTMPEEDQIKETKSIKLGDIKNAPNGKFAIQQYSKQHNTTIWYI